MQGYTPLHTCAEKLEQCYVTKQACSAAELAVLLLKHGADRGIKNQQASPALAYTHLVHAFTGCFMASCRIAIFAGLPVVHAVKPHLIAQYDPAVACLGTGCAKQISWLGQPVLSHCCCC